MGEFILGDTQTGASLKLPAVLDFAAAEAFLKAARDVAEKSCEIDASEVARFSTPCAQVLLALLKSNENSAVVNPSEAFSEALAELGLAEQIASRTK